MRPTETGAGSATGRNVTFRTEGPAVESSPAACVGRAVRAISSATAGNNLRPNRPSIPVDSPSSLSYQCIGSPIELANQIDDRVHGLHVEVIRHRLEVVGRLM